MYLTPGFSLLKNCNKRLLKKLQHFNIACVKILFIINSYFWRKMKTIALLGRPNVGKSSLFNRLARKRIAITSDISGTTRDTQYQEILIDEKPCQIIDTGGLDEGNLLFDKIKEKSIETANEADILLYLVDGKFYPDEEDQKLFYQLSKLNKPIALVVNKADNKQERERAWEFGNFGVKNLFIVSVSHNHGIDDLTNWISSLLPKNESETIFEDDEESLEDFLSEELSENSEINIGIIGRVNVGKSSLLNALVGRDRAIVSEVAGTTIDPVDDVVFFNEYSLNFVDTAGLRRRGKIEGIEKYALNRTEAILEKSDIALLVLDASTPLTELDERIAGLVEKFNLSVIIVLNKWDIANKEFKEAILDVRDRFKFLSFAPIITVSALSKKRVVKIFDLIVKVYENYKKRVPTSKLNTLIKEAQLKHPIPSQQGKLVKIYFATQFDVKPPKIALVMNRPRALHFSYKRYLINHLRKNIDFEGSPIVLFPRKRGEDEEFE